MSLKKKKKGQSDIIENICIVNKRPSAKTEARDFHALVSCIHGDRHNIMHWMWRSWILFKVSDKTLLIQVHKIPAEKKTGKETLSKLCKFYYVHFLLLLLSQKILTTAATNKNDKYSSCSNSFAGTAKKRNNSKIQMCGKSNHSYESWDNNKYMCQL